MILFFGNAPVLYFIGLVLLLVLYFYWAFSHGQARLISELRADLVDISKERLLLLSDFNEQVKIVARERVAPLKASKNKGPRVALNRLPFSQTSFPKFWSAISRE